MMRERPRLTTGRLLLRPFEVADAPEVKRLAGDREIAATTLQVPHPYEDGMAEEWISSHQEKWESGELVNFAVVRREDDQLLGAIGLVVRREHRRAELGYWMGKPFWGRGYTTEAARAVVAFGFDHLDLVRIYAHCMKGNPASVRVLEKTGMRHEGCLRGHVEKWGEFKDLEVFGILRNDYESG
jgi:RimJ/RimL family protein N-acetyltransferase